MADSAATDCDGTVAVETAFVNNTQPDRLARRQPRPLAARHLGMSRTRSRKQENLADEPAVLSAREREALHWAVEGKNDWEIGEVMNISEQSADKHHAADPREARSDQRHASCG